MFVEQINLNHIMVKFEGFGSTIGRLGGRVVEVISKQSPEVKAFGLVLISLLTIGILGYVGSMIIEKVNDSLNVRIGKRVVKAEEIANEAKDIGEKVIE